MNVWVITVGETLPLADNKDRLMRAGLISEVLTRRGHQILWWTSTVNHFRKAFFVEGEPRIKINQCLSLQFLDGCLYRRNVSFNRLRNHKEVARSFVDLAGREPKPDIILCSFPTIELSREAVRYARAAGIPVILDVRDLWPDIFVDVVPRRLRRIGQWLLRDLFTQTAWSFANCSAVFAISKGYLDWGLSRGKRQLSTNDVVYPLGYQMSEYSSSDELALNQRLIANGVDTSKPFVLFVGTFGRTYDLATVIRAAKWLASQGNSSMQFVLCGSGEREREWRSLANGVAGVAFLGWLPAGELACLLGRSIVGLAAYAPGAPQGIPNKVIEYLAAALPIVCSLNGESRQLIEDEGCGLYYAANDHVALAQNLTRLLSDEQLRAEMTEAAQRVFNSRFSAAAVYGEMANHLERMALR